MKKNPKPQLHSDSIVHGCLLGSGGACGIAHALHTQPLCLSLWVLHCLCKVSSHLLQENEGKKHPATSLVMHQDLKQYPEELSNFISKHRGTKQVQCNLKTSKSFITMQAVSTTRQIKLRKLKYDNKIKSYVTARDFSPHRYSVCVFQTAVDLTTGT